LENGKENPVSVKSATLTRMAHDRWTDKWNYYA